MECLLAIGTSVLEKVANYTVVAIGRQLGYIFYYKSNVDNLNNQTQELGVRKNRLGNRVEEARRNGEEIEGDVQDWLKEVEQIAEKTNSFLEDERHTKTRCSGCSFPNIVLRHKLSRKAKKMIQTVESEIQKTEKFESISSHPILQWSIENKGYETFESRKEIFKEIFEALKDPNVNMIGVYGMGGIGKTMLAKEVARQTMEEKIFNETIFASVSQTPNIEKIQQEVAEKLGLQKFDEIKSISVRAVRLRLRLRQEKRILIILDDVWEELNLFDVGIYFEDDQKGCKIMLTSRSVDVLQNFTNVIAKNFPIEVVSFDEARSLFKRTVGDKVGNPSFHSLIDEMVTECAGLPLAIRTVAYALKDKGLSTWKDALLQLKRSTSTNIEGMSEKVYSSIKLSFDLLGSEEAKTLLLLCCLHEEDANIYIENLMGYSVGWGLFPDVDTLEETRDRVHSLVDKLKGKCLLLEGEYHGTIKVHDVIRDVSISIASKDRRMNIVTNVAKLEEHMNKRVLKDSIAISLIDHHLDRLPSRLEFPQLELFFMFNVSRSLLIPDHFFEETKELRALYLSYVYQGSLPSSFYFLQSLQTLSLRNCKLRDIAIIGELKNLKILDLSDSDIEQLPKQIGQLRGLRVLNLSWCYGLKVIQPHVISSLVNLEELSLETFTEWEVERSDTERSNASLTELKNLSQLTTLQLCVLDANILPRDLFTENIKRYQVFIGGRSYRYGYERYGSRFLHLDLPKSILSYDHAGLDILIKRSEVVHLAGFEGLHNIVYELQNEGFSQVKNFLLKNNAQIRYIVDTTDKIQPCSAFENLDTLILGTLVNLEEICYGELSADSFGKLRQTFVRNCDSL
ncbi:NB-ARC domain containing protein, partial [Parasponia andersonii]